MPTFTIRTGEPALEEALRLLRQTSWAVHRPEAVMEQAIRHSLCVAAYDEEGRAIAFARLITDYAIYAYLADVVVDEAWRGQGVGKALMAFIMELELVKGLRRFTLLTGDAQEFYRPYGFTELARPGDYMQVFRGDVDV